MKEKTNRIQEMDRDGRNEVFNNLWAYVNNGIKIVEEKTKVLDWKKKLQTLELLLTVAEGLKNPLVKSVNKACLIVLKNVPFILSKARYYLVNSLLYARRLVGCIFITLNFIVERKLLVKKKYK